MTFKIVKFDPRNLFYHSILSGEKHQTIRDKPIKVGQKVRLWEYWRGMKTGLYCPVCWKWIGRVGSTATILHGCMETPIPFPRLLRETEILECIPISMRYYDASPPFLAIMKKGKKIVIPWSPYKRQHNFVKKDTPNWSNTAFIEFFRKTYPDIKQKEVQFYIWRWKV